MKNAMTIPVLSPNMKLIVFAGVLIVLAVIFSPLLGQEKPSGKAATLLSDVLAQQEAKPR